MQIKHIPQLFVHNIAYANHLWRTPKVARR